MDSRICLSEVEIAVDTGGTFTDLVCCDEEGRVLHAKIPSTPDDPARSIEAVIRHVTDVWKIAPQKVKRFIHGTTVGTNAVLERKGAKLALLTTKGFRDTLEIGRFNRADDDLYKAVPSPNTPDFLVPRQLRIDVEERMSADGSVVTPLDEGALRATLHALRDTDIRAVAISYLYSFMRPEHEERTEELVREYLPDVVISRSSVVDPALREYERTSVVCFDAYIKPVLDGYLKRAGAALAASGISCPFQVIHSRGGVTKAEMARQQPVRLFLSGPAGGVIGGAALAERASKPNVVTLDIGGTSSDIALIRSGAPLIAQSGFIDGYSVRVPMVDVNSIGAGGGSIAWLDRVGGLHVGPQSAGADPGPACYGNGGDLATVTDASVVLGYINPQTFAGGAIAIDPDRANAVIERCIARPMGISVIDAALGIHRVANAHMAEGIRFVSVKRGLDPRKFTLMPLGGGGGLHAFQIAGILGMSRVLLPPLPGVMSAMGMLTAPIQYERSRGCPAELDAIPAAGIRRILRELEAECMSLMEGESLPGGPIEVLYAADLCYVGQSYYLEVPVDLQMQDPRGQMRTAFDALHEQVYGHATKGHVQIVSLRTIVQAAPGERRNAGLWPGTTTGGERTKRKIILEGFKDGILSTVIDRASLDPNELIEGPAVLEQSDTTTVIPPGWKGKIHAEGSILVEAMPDSERNSDAA